MQRCHLFRLIDTGYIRTPRLRSTHVFEHMVLALPIEKVCRSLPSVPLAHKRDQPIWIGIRQCPQKHRVHNAEDRSVRANAKRQREQSNGSKERRLSEIAKRITKILEEGIHVVSYVIPSGASPAVWERRREESLLSPRTRESVHP